MTDLLASEIVPGVEAEAAATVEAEAPPAAGKPKRKRPPSKPRARGDAAPKPPPRGPGRPSTRDVRERKLGENLAALGLLVAAVAHPADGLAIVEHSAGIAKSFAQLADENARVARLLDGAMESSAWFGVIASVGGLAVAIAANHGLLGSGPEAGVEADPLASMAAMFATVPEAPPADGR